MVGERLGRREVRRGSKEPRGEPATERASTETPGWGAASGEARVPAPPGLQDRKLSSRNAGRPEER